MPTAPKSPVRHSTADRHDPLEVTQEMEFARRIGDRVVFMRSGIVHEMGSSTDMFEAPKPAEPRQLLSAMNIDRIALAEDASCNVPPHWGRAIAYGLAEPLERAPSP